MSVRDPSPSRSARLLGWRPLQAVLALAVLAVVVPMARSSRSGLTRMAATSAPPTIARAKDSRLNESVVLSPSA